MTEAEWAYIAGFFDGEGHAGIVSFRRKPGGPSYRRLMVFITNTDLGVLEWVKAEFGRGHIQHHMKAGTSTRQGIVSRREGYRYVLQSLAAYDFLLGMRPYLKVKSSQVNVLLASPRYGRVEAA